MKLHLDNNIAEGTPEELVEYLRLIEAESTEKPLFPFGHEHQPTEDDTFQGVLGSLKIDKSSIGSEESSADEAETASTDIQVGDRVKVLNSKFGAEGEATVTAVFEDGYVELAGTNETGRYSTDWSNHVSSLEKIEAEEDSPMGYTFWYIDGTQGRKLNVLKATLDGDFEDSTGTRYTYQAVSGLVKPIDKENAREKFENARHSGKLLKYYPAVDLFVKEY